MIENHTASSGIDPINIIRHLPHTLATAIKYVWRFNHKWNPAEDLGKAEFYLNDYRAKTFETKEFDMAFHKATLIGAKSLMGCPLRTDFRKHIVYLEEIECASVPFFNLIYNFLQEAATYETVNYRMIRSAGEELTRLMKVSSSDTEDEGSVESEDVKEEVKEEVKEDEEWPNNAFPLSDFPHPNDKG